jgi:hypothetical protein
MQHLDEGTIHAWLDGALPSDEAAAVERHARECAACAALVADARGMIAGATRIVSALDDVPGGVIPRQPTETATRSLWRTLRLTPFRAALAASVLVVVGSFAVIRHTPKPSSAADTVRTIPAVAAVPTAPAPAPTKAEAMPTRPLSKTVSAKRLRVQDEAPPSTSVAAASATREEAARRVPSAEMAKVAALADSVRAARGVAAGATAAAPAAAPMAQAPAANGLSRVTSRDAALRNAADVPSQPFSLAFTSADNRPLTPGCYQVSRDSGDARLPLPDRFSLDNERNSAVGGNVVRALTEDGRRDSILTGITWQPAPGAPNLVVVRRESPMRSSLRQQTIGSAMSSSFNRDKPVRLSRIECR